MKRSAGVKLVISVTLCYTGKPGQPEGAEEREGLGDGGKDEIAKTQ